MPSPPRLELRLPVPPGWEPAPATEVSLSTAPGLSWTLQRAWQDPASDARVEASCVALPSGLWLRGLGPMLLDAAAGKARQIGGFHSLTPSAVTTLGHEQRRPFQAEGGPHGRANGLQLLAFNGAEAQLCTLVCRAPIHLCESTLAAAHFQGTLQPAPHNTWPARAVTLLSTHPQITAASLLSLVLLGSAYILWRRPRKKAVSHSAQA